MGKTKNGKMQVYQLDVQTGKSCGFFFNFEKNIQFIVDHITLEVTARNLWKVPRNRLKFSWKNSDSKADIFQWDSFPRPSGTMSKHAKNPCPGQEVATFGEATKRE